MNSHTVQIIGLSEIEEPLEIGKSYELKIQADCITITKNDTQDGNFTFKYKLRQQTAEITKDNGEVVKTKDKTKQSTKLAAQIRIQAEQEDKDPDQQYQHYMTLLRHYWLIIKDTLDKLNV